MSPERETRDWNELVSIAAEEIPPVRSEHLHKHLSECRERQQKLDEMAGAGKNGEPPNKQGVRTRGWDYSRLGKRRVPLLIAGGVVITALLLVVAGRQGSNGFVSPRASRKMTEVSSLSASLGDSGQEAAKEKAESRILAPMIARSVALSIVVKDCVAARATLESLLARHGGYAADLAVSADPNSPRSLQASLRIPAGELAEAIPELRALGTVESESQKGEEVTQQHSDLVARLKNSRETELRLQAILQQRTGKMSDVLEVEQEISRVRGEIEGMESEQKALEHRVNFASVDLRLGEEYHAQLATPSLANRFRNATVGGFQSAADTVVAMVIFCMNYGPSILLWLAILFLPARLLWKRTKGMMVKEIA